MQEFTTRTSDNEPGREPAGRWRRFWAAMLDAAMLGIPFVVAVVAIIVVVASRDGVVVHEGTLTRINPGFRDDVRILTVWVGAIGWIATTAYVVPPTATWGQTLGKHALGIKVVRSVDGAVPGWGAAVLRYVVYSSPSWVALSLPVLGIQGLSWLATVGNMAIIIPILFDDQRRGVHDMAAATLVVSARRQPVEQASVYGASAGW